MGGWIRIRGAREHNLRGIDVAVPRGRLTVVTGVSGSGKSSLAFDTLHAAGQRRYLETLSQRARQFVEQLPEPAVDSIEGLTPTIALAQGTVTNQPRSTAGTLSGLWDLLRLLYGRRGERADGRRIEGHRGPWLFSFNTPRGACPGCKGLGVEDRVDPELLVADPDKTLREGALVPTLPNGYIVYSQVTVDVLDEVCRAHGFDVDTPWRELTDAQREVVFFGSDRLEVPFGKHSLESRMRWEGIKAQPREMGFYKGLIPTIADTLKRNRNANVLRFVRSEPCSACGGTRLNDDARAVQVAGLGIAEAAAMPLAGLADWLGTLRLPADDAPLAQQLHARVAACCALGLGHLSCARSAPGLSGGETQRLRLAAITAGGAGLSGVTYVFDEPSIGLHASEEQAVLDALLQLRNAGNTVVVVEHSAAALRAADHLIDIGPGAGPHGGELLYAGPPSGLGDADPRSATRRETARGDLPAPSDDPPAADDPTLRLRGATLHNLRGGESRFRLRNLNVVCGVAGAGKSSLVDATLARELRRRLHGATDVPGPFQSLTGDQTLRKVVHVDQSPIGRTPRSNPATYTGLYDRIRATFAGLPAASEQGLKAGHFSFNVKADRQGRGRCETCEGAGRETVTLHGLPAVEIGCRSCGGARFGPEVLAVRWQGRSIREVLDATVEDARGWFADDAKAARILDALHGLGLDYLTLGQPATTLSGGEAQRVKLATELARPAARGGATLYILDEPTVGLHGADVHDLLAALADLRAQGQTVLVVEHDLTVLAAANHLVELGPGAGSSGGQVVFQGTPSELVENADTATARALRAPDAPTPAAPATHAYPGAPPMRLLGVRTHGLHALDVDLPATGLTVVTGVSGSGKSSLVFDTLHAEARARFTEHLSAHARRQLGAAGSSRGRFDEASGLRPTVALGQQVVRYEAPRSTVATLAGLHPLLRVLFSRAGVTADGTPTELPAGAFSFHRRDGACPDCAGLGQRMRCAPDKLVTAPDHPLFDGALAGTRSGKPYGDPDGKHRALVDALGTAHGFDPAQPWRDLDEAARRLILDGDPDGREYQAVWRFRRGKRAGEHEFTAAWPGLCAEIEAEYARKRDDAKRRRALEDDVMRPVTCPTCDGSRLAAAARAVRFAGRTLPEVTRLRLTEARDWLVALDAGEDTRGVAVLDGLRPELLDRLARLLDLGLGHLALDRASDTLSAGEHQRTRLAAHLAAPLGGVVYVLDEPTLGLHPRDVAGLLGVLRGLVAAGNGVVCIEHDLDVLRAADHVVELGPGGGAAGGRIVATGAPEELPPTSRSARLLAEAPATPARQPRPHGAPLTIRGARLHDLQDLDVTLPGGCITAVAGVSGSGKTSLVFGVLAATANGGRPVGCERVDGLEGFDVVVDATRGLRRTSARTTVAAAAGTFFAELRKRFAAMDKAGQHGLKAAAFQHTGKAGQCPTCKGVGRIRSELDFLGDLWIDCETCQGQRYRPEILEVRWRKHSIADVLGLTVAEALELCADEPPRLRGPLERLVALRLGAVRLGQGTDTLSGGEAQRLQLAEALLTETRGGRHLYLLDEPTRGLHADDVAPLLALFDRLADAGHTVVVIEHDAQVIAAADLVVELGPGSGPDGGRVVHAGPPTVTAR